MAMRLQNIILARKENITHGLWRDDKLKSKDFPMGRRSGKVYPLTPRWRWRVSQMEILGRKFRLLSAYHKLVPEFTAVLAEDMGNDSKVVSCLEFHQSHVGWHVHACCEIDSTVVGVARPIGAKRFPDSKRRHRSADFLRSGHTAMADDIAEEIAASFFRLPYQPTIFSGMAIPW